ncbi:MAG TPA: AlkA N-terminal domain-containing protein [Blastocatellia bacterium]|nr:AlkA N-terminal domain-containing protein [Blastocatellia bacterium]
MNLDRRHCYSALKSRDERFDGRFFATVLTTGVYCRPICPAPTPRPENVRFVPCAAAAEEAGFRPCLRCHPETSPGTPAWLGASSTVSRALRLISDGALDEASVEDLAGRLGIGERHLRRLFEKHLGASPVAVAQTRRTHFAKKLIDETSLPVTEIAYIAGFSSIRRFNDIFRKSFGKSPSQCRRGKTGDDEPEDSRLCLRLAYRPPFDWRALSGFLRARAIPGVESIDETAYRRTVRIGDASGVIEVRPIEGRSHLLLSVPPALSKGLAQIAERVRRLFDLKADPVEITNHLKQDPALADAIRSRPGLRVPGAWDGFEIGVRAILGQQVSVSAATTLSGRLVEACGDALLAADRNGLRYLFPDPERLSREKLTNIGLPSKRAEAIREFARAVRDGAVELTTSASLESTIERLTALSGVGAWTAHYIAMRALGEPDAFPSGDLVLRRAAARRRGETLRESDLLERAEQWRPWRAYAALYLWTSYTNRNGA